MSGKLLIKPIIITDEKFTDSFCLDRKVEVEVDVNQVVITITQHTKQGDCWQDSLLLDRNEILKISTVVEALK
jgi:hypothetical protein